MISKYKKKVKYSSSFYKVNNLLKANRINTICHGARCPNIGECFLKKKLTFMILGNTCTRGCSFCNVKKGRAPLPDKDEPVRIRKVVEQLKLKYVVITSVTRDDLPDGGCSVYDELVSLLKETDPGIKVELLIPDFNGNTDALQMICQSNAEVIGHNIETVERLFPVIRPKADFRRSLSILRQIKEIAPLKLTKSGFMVGLGESFTEIEELLSQLFEQKVDIITVGQYFQPSLQNVPVKKMYTDDEFQAIKEKAKETGFKHISAGRFVRSSYYAEEVYQSM